MKGHPLVLAEPALRSCLSGHLAVADGSEVSGIRMCTVSGSPDQVE